ncbi:acyltransferase family protein [Poriferisphaera sp. WC338]|uniref:acyltransferase family protein n=1 Tax=Poriferisphaera sp. WC338 TaxID=3425129 RepID=UPI003D8125BB
MRLYCIDIIRGISSLAIVLLHSSITFWLAVFPDILYQPIESVSQFLIYITTLTCNYGWIGVRILIVLSGFCVYLGIAARKPERIPIFPFMKKRILRLYPTYFCVLLCAMLFTILFYRADLTFQNILGHLIFWYHNFYPVLKEPAEFSSVFWFMSLIAQLYLVFTLLYPFIRKHGLGAVCLATLTFSIVWHVFYIYTTAQLNWEWYACITPRHFVLANIGEWLVGAYLAECWHNKQHEQLRTKLKLSLPLTLIISIAIFLSVIIFKQYNDLRFEYRDSFNLPLTAATFLLMLYMITLEGRTMQRKQAANLPHKPRNPLTKIIIFVSDRSYSLYLIHVTVIAFMGQVGIRLFNLKIEDAPGSFLWLLTIIAGIIIAFIATEFLYRFVELPSHQWVRKLSRPPASPTTTETQKIKT